MRVRHCVIIMLLIGISAPPILAQNVSQPAEWKGTIGTLGLLTPSYEGSDEHRFVPLPLVLLTFHDRFYFGPSATGVGGAAGAYVLRSERTSVSVESGISDGRPAERSVALAGMNDRSMIASVASTVTYALGAFEGAATLSHGLNGDAGALARVQFGMRNRAGRTSIQTSIAATWVDADEMRRSFGITDAEASRRQSLIAAGDSRLRPGDGSAYSPAGGLKQIGASVLAIYPLSEKWSLVALGSASRLGNIAARSPVVRKRGQFSMALGAGRQVHWGGHD